MIELRNAIIRGATLSTADHGLLSSFLDLDYGGSGQGFGGYALFSPGWTLSANYAGLWIWRCLEVAGVTEWSQLKGRTIRAKFEWTKVHSIGHIVKDIWFDPANEFKALEQIPLDK